MADVEAKALDSPDETRTFDKGMLELLNLTSATIGRVPWSRDGGGRSASSRS